LYYEFKQQGWLTELIQAKLILEEGNEKYIDLHSLIAQWFFANA
jgi:hypothetical protein